MLSDLLQSLRCLPALCRGDVARMRDWLEHPRGVHLLACAVAIFTGGLVYGYTLGMWRAPGMGLLVAVKIPLLVLMTLAANGVINGMMALVLGSGLGFRQTLMAMLMSFAAFSLITCALSPVTLALSLSVAAPGEPGSATAYRLVIVVHTLIIAYAGFMGNRRFLPVILAASATRLAGYRVFFTWLAGNLFVDTQLAWIFRPFFGQESQAVEFMRDDWRRSNFYVILASHAGDLWHSLGPALQTTIGWSAVLFCALPLLKPTKSKPFTLEKSP